MPEKQKNNLDSLIKDNLRLEEELVEARKHISYVFTNLVGFMASVDNIQIENVIGYLLYPEEETLLYHKQVSEWSQKQRDTVQAFLEKLMEVAGCEQMPSVRVTSQYLEKLGRDLH